MGPGLKAVSMKINAIFLLMENYCCISPLKEVCGTPVMRGPGRRLAGCPGFTLSHFGHTVVPWGGGGCFDDERSVILRGSSGTHPDHPLNGLRVLEGNCECVVSTPDIPSAQWSGFDQGGYPVFALDGKLYRRLPGGDNELADFNNLSPRPEEAPTWAKKPLSALN
jgi:hypothetical protein